jgi:3-isopropylmalate/(R)-2-methylmalate dehydratase small subunit
MKKKLSRVTSSAIPLRRDNVDTDQILPARYLKAITREGFGEKLFRDWRFDADDQPKPDFVLNNPAYYGEILLAGHNFGGGSSREHAAWALADYGFSVVVSSYFGDIFKANALNNSLLPVEVSPDVLKRLFDTVETNPATVIEIDVDKQTIAVPALRLTESFDIDPYRKICLINGYDDIDYLVSMKPKIEAFEQGRKDDYSIA